MIEDVFEGIFIIFGRFVGYIIIEILFEIVLKGPGCVIYRLFSKQDPQADALVVTLLGLIFWVVIGFIGYMIYSGF